MAMEGATVWRVLRFGAIGGTSAKEDVYMPTGQTKFTHDAPPLAARDFHRLLTAEEAAALIGASLSWLRRARSRGQGRVATVIGTRGLCQLSDLEDFLAGRVGGD